MVAPSSDENANLAPLQVVDRPDHLQPAETGASWTGETWRWIGVWNSRQEAERLQKAAFLYAFRIFTASIVATLAYDSRSIKLATSKNLGFL